jgi:tight adherence protein B
MSTGFIALVVIVVAGASVLFGQFLYWWLEVRQTEESRELSRRLGTADERPVSSLLRGPEARPEKGFAARMDDLIRQAGSPFPIEQLWTRMAVGAGVGALVLGVVLRGPLAVVGLLAGYVPVLLLSSQAQARARRLAEQLPDALDLVSRSLQAGHGLSDAIRSVSEEIAEPLGAEFGRVAEENNLGRDLRECFQHLVRRNPSSFDLQIFVSAVLLQRDTGGNLVEILNNIAGTIRQRFVFQGKVAALTSEARFTAWILGGLPFFVAGAILFLQPNYLRPLIEDPLGNLLLGGCAVMFCLGVFLMRESAKVEV